MARGILSTVGHVSVSALLALSIAGCGGSGSGESATPPDVEQKEAEAPTASTTTAPGGLYVGYYLEDPATNPEDPTPGAFILNLPEGDAPFSGSMFFTYVGCQSTNVGTVNGNKSGANLAGIWAGTLDGTPQSGPYEGAYNADGGFYSGTFANSGGKQFKRVPGCIDYYIAPNGTWEMMPVNSHFPPSFHTSVAESSITWAGVTDLTVALGYVLDPALLQAGKDPVIWQDLTTGGAGKLPINTTGLVSGKEYVAVTVVFGAGYQRLAVGSVKFSLQ